MEQEYFARLLARIEDMAGQQDATVHPYFMDRLCPAAAELLASDRELLPQTA